MPRKSLIALLIVSPLSVFGSNVSTDAQLQTAIINANSGADTTINFQNNITIGAGISPNLNLRPVNATGQFAAANQTIAINGNGFTLNGANTFRGFFVNQSTTSVTISNLTFNQTAGRGGNGAPVGGGGGGGLGGALFVDAGATLILVNPTFSNCSAVGGSGAASVNSNRGGGGGGGFAGAGGEPLTIAAGGGGGINANGGGGGSPGSGNAGSGGGAGLAPVGTAGTNNATAGGNNFSNEAGSGGAGGTGASINGGNGVNGGAGGGGGNSGAAAGSGNGGAGSRGGGGGGGGSSSGAGLSNFTGRGGNGGDFAGGGGAASPFSSTGGIPNSGGSGGFGGGGGASGGGQRVGLTGGAGGFGGGGGRGQTTAGVGGFGGGNGNTTLFGGGGAGFGGALFLRGDSSGAAVGAQVTIEGSCFFSGNSVTAGLAGGAGAQAGLASGPDIFMMSSSQLTFNLTQDFVLPSPIVSDSGAGNGSQTLGGLVKNGSARLELVGVNEYTGRTTVNAGTLAINGSVVTEVVVEAGGMLTGNFSILASDGNPQAGNLTNRGTLAPGNNGPGEITIEGDLTLASSSVLIVDVLPDGRSDRVSVINSSTADLGNSTLNILVNEGNYIPGTTFQIISGSVGSTRFGTIVQSGPLANQVRFEVIYDSVFVRVLNNIIFEHHNVASGIPTIVADCFRQATIVPGSDFAVITEILGLLSDSAVNAALRTLAPTPFGALEWINARNNSYVVELLSKHLFELCCATSNCDICDCNASVWVDVFGNIMDNFKTQDNLSPFDANAVGAVGGIDFCCDTTFCRSNVLCGGLSAGYTRTHLIWKDRGGGGNCNSYYGAVYGSLQGDRFSIDYSALGGVTDQQLRRRMVFANIDRTARSDPGAYFFTGHLGLKRRAYWHRGTAEFFALGDYHYYHRRRFKEKGADSLNLAVKGRDQRLVRGEAGLRLYREELSDCYCLAPYIGLSAVADVPLNDSKQKAHFVDQSCPLDVVSYDSIVYMASPQLGGKWTGFNGASFSLGYKGFFNRRLRINQVDARFEWIF